MGLVVVILVVGIPLLPAEAWAWGPLTHLAHGTYVLRDLTIAGLALQGTLRRHAREYLYGCIGADITQAKRYTRALEYHCHSWKVGWEILQRAASEAQRAFAYGYLSHLAGDVFSHNHYVPTQLVVSYRARALRHIYWEARFDSLQSREYRHLLSDLGRSSFPQCDSLIREVVTRTLFSFRTDKRIFDSVLAWQQFEQWHTLMSRVSSRSRFPLPREMVHAYNALCVENIKDLLARGTRSACQRADPTGTEAIALAKDVRRKLKRIVRRRQLTRAVERQIQELTLRPEFLAA